LLRRTNEKRLKVKVCREGKDNGVRVRVKVRVRGRGRVRVRVKGIKVSVR